MSRIGIFYGSTLGTTKKAAEDLAALFGEDAALIDVAQAETEDFEKYPMLLLGSSTWGYGDLQDDWSVALDKLEGVDLSDKKVALFGYGDQEGYADTFVDALGILYDKVRERKGVVVGAWPSEDFTFSSSKAFREGRFVGLPLDDNNQAELTEDRLQQWVEQLKKELAL